MMSVIVIDPPRYICVACGQTGTVVEGGRWGIQQPDASKDRRLVAKANALKAKRAGLAEFIKVARAHRRAKVRGV